MTPTDPGMRHRPLRQRRAAAAIVLACVTSAVGTTFAATSAPPAHAANPSCTLTSASAPLTVTVILDAAHMPVATEVPTATTATTGITAAPTVAGSDPPVKYDDATLSDFVGHLVDLGYTVKLLAISDVDSSQKFRIRKSDVEALTLSKFSDQLINHLNPSGRNVVLNFDSELGKPDSLRSNDQWVNSTDSDGTVELSTPDPDLSNVESDISSYSIANVKLQAEPKPDPAININEKHDAVHNIGVTNSDLFAYGDGTKISDSGAVPFGNASVQVLTSSGILIPCSFAPDPKIADPTFPVDALLKDVSGSAAFLVQPPSGTQPGSNNLTSKFVPGLKSLLPGGACIQQSTSPSTTLSKAMTVLPPCDPTGTRNTASTGGIVSSSKSRGSSPVGVLGGGLAGLLVGAGAGAALMASRRRNDDDPNGRRMAPAYPPTGPPSGPTNQGPTEGRLPGPVNGLADTATIVGAGAVLDAAAAPVASAAGAHRASVGAIIGGSGTTHDWTVAAPGGGTVRLEDIGVTRIMPTTTEHGRVWAVGNDQYAATSGWLEKRNGKGEDAEPTLRIHSSGRGIVGVYDGTGGAGAAIARTTGEGTDLSAAYVAARLVRDVFEAWFVDRVNDDDHALETGALAATLQQVLKEEARHLPQSRSNIRGKLHRVLPTTAACIAFDAADPSGTVDALWAGDSRCFLLTPSKGLQVLSKDDTRESDALELIRNDQPMENLVAADRPFRINHRRFTPDQPMVLLTATDGAFGYVRTPAHFEYLLLHTLHSASSLDDWSARLLATISEFAADDVSFSVVATGFDGFEALREAMQARHDYLAREHWKPFVDKTGDADAIEHLRGESWAVYRDLYHARMIGPDAPTSADSRPQGQ